jgi:hypothetical protein
MHFRTFWLTFKKQLIAVKKLKIKFEFNFLKRIKILVRILSKLD